MNNGFMFLLAGLVVLAALLAGMSMGSHFTAAAPKSSSDVATLAANPQPALNLSLPQSVSPPPAPLPPAPGPGSPKLVLKRTRNEEPKRDINWLYASKPALLRKAPAGDPYSASSICFAPLTILPGTRLWPMEVRGEWIMVRSPSSMIGWLARSEVERRTANRHHIY
jgi:hypothetical protein